MATDSVKKQPRAAPMLPRASQFIFDEPTQIPIADLLNPVMVKISVRNKAEEDPPGLESATFEITRGIICAKSDYFEKAFRGQFKKASERTLALDDVSPWIFKVFLTWVYTGQIYIDKEEVTALQPDIGRKRKRSDSVAEGPASEAPNKVNPPDTQIGTQDPNSDSEDDDDGSDSGRVKFTFSEETSIKSRNVQHSDTQAPDERDLTNPSTWPWSWLFDLYVFADQYDTVRLREQIMNFIQLRLDQRYPRMYCYPDSLDTQRCVDRLPSTSPLRRLLVDLWAKNIQVHDKKDPRVGFDAKAMNGLPAGFVIECFVALKCVLETYRCNGQNCRTITHDHGGSPVMQYTDRCRYHEHDATNFEREKCADLWRILHEVYEVTGPKRGFLREPELSYYHEGSRLGFEGHLMLDVSYTRYTIQGQPAESSDLLDLHQH